MTHIHVLSFLIVYLKKAAYIVLKEAEQSLIYVFFCPPGTSYKTGLNGFICLTPHSETHVINTSKGQCVRKEE